MTTTKKISPRLASSRLRAMKLIALLRAGAYFRDELPDDPDGIEVTEEEFIQLTRDFLTVIEPIAIKMLKDVAGDKYEDVTDDEAWKDYEEDHRKREEERNKAKDPDAHLLKTFEGCKYKSSDGEDRTLEELAVCMEARGYQGLITIVGGLMSVDGKLFDAANKWAAGETGGQVDLVFKQTYQLNEECGVWFTGATLVVSYIGGLQKIYDQYEDIFIKKTSGKTGRFTADTSDFAGNIVEKAILYMMLEPDEGIANGDNVAVIEVTDGTTGEFVRLITAKGDIKGRGYSKINPKVPIDFTDYVSKL